MERSIDSVDQITLIISVNCIDFVFFCHILDCFFKSLLNDRLNRLSHFGFFFLLFILIDNIDRLPFQILVYFNLMVSVDTFSVQNFPMDRMLIYTRIIKSILIKSMIQPIQHELRSYEIIKLNRIRKRFIMGLYSEIYGFIELSDISLICSC